MSRTKRCEVCGQKKLKVICITCVEKDMKNWEKRMVQKGKLEQKKEELEFLDDCFRESSGVRYIQEGSIGKLKDRIKQLQKEIGEEKGK